MLFCFRDALERGCNEGAFDIFLWGRRVGWVASCDGEVVDEFENEEAGECAAKVRDTDIISCGLWKDGTKETVVTYVASRVMYVPPMAGSAIFAWKAEMATNMTVLVKVEKICEAITVSRYQGCTPSAGKTMTTSWAIQAATRRPMKAQHQTWIGGLDVDQRPA